ncbi:MAG TPA: vWA domain-containing protein, partial [Candidatus Obscuribacterales bacterium]
MKLRSSLTRLALALVLLTAFASNAALLAAEERPVNFIFLVDVSGSMVLKSTMVKAADGSEITLFEALRNALKQMVSDPRLINPASRVAFITFGTQVSEKSDWPEKLQQEEHRKELIEKISNPATLSADKHGDTICL